MCYNVLIISRDYKLDEFQKLMEQERPPNYLFQVKRKYKYDVYN